MEVIILVNYYSAWKRISVSGPAVYLVVIQYTEPGKILSKFATVETKTAESKGRSFSTVAHLKSI